MYFSDATERGQTPETNKMAAAMGVIVLIYWIYCEIGEYKIREEYIILTEEGIEYIGSKKNEINKVLWEDIQKIRYVKRGISWSRITDIKYEKKTGGMGYLDLEYALESRREIYEQVIRFWETYR